MSDHAASLPLSERWIGVWLFVVVLAVYTWIYVTAGVRDPGLADGHYSFLYARSLVFDRDLDFRNDYAVCGDAFQQGIDRGTGRLDNPSYPGPALVWVPVLAVARALVRVPSDAEAAVRSACRGPLARATLVVAVPLGALAIVLSYQAARSVAGSVAAVLAAALFAFASSLPHYGAVFVSSSHVFECLFAAMCVWATVRARWLLVGGSLMALTVQRLPDAWLAIVPLTVIATSTLAIRHQRTAAALTIAGAATGVAIMLGLFTYLYGAPWVLPQGRDYVFLAHSHPLLLLFAPQGGLLYTTPGAYAAFAGLALACRDPRVRPLALASFVVMAGCLWLAASPLDWQGKTAFGARRLVVLTPLFVIWAAHAFQMVFERVAADDVRIAAAASAVAVIAVSVPVTGAVLGTAAGKTPLEAAPFAAGTAGIAYRVMAAVGDVAILPGKLFYALRFRVPAQSFGFAATDLFYRRSYRDLSWEPQTLVFSHVGLREPSRGTGPDSSGLVLREPDAAVVFTAGWPFADVARLDVRTSVEGPLALSLATTFHRCELGERYLAPGPNVMTFAIPRGCFDSGLVELGFRSAPQSHVVIERLTLDDTRALPPPF